MNGGSLHKLISAMKNNCENKSIQYKASMNVASELVSKVSNAKKENKPMSYEDFCFYNEDFIIAQIKNHIQEVDIPIGIYGAWIVQLDVQKEYLMRHHYNKYKEILNEQ